MATKITTGVIDSAITSALIADASITADDLHTTLDLTGKTLRSRRLRLVIMIPQSQVQLLSQQL